jgi:hypothetical protein
MGKLLRGALALLTTFALTGAGLLVGAQPASASVDRHFDGWDISGTVTFYGQHSYRIRTTTYNPYTNGGVGFQARGDFFAGNARRACTGHPQHWNWVYDSVKTFTDNGNCTIAAIDQIVIFEFLGDGSIGQEIYVNNPYRE